MLRTSETDSSKIRSATSEEKKACQLNGSTDGVGTAMSEDPEADEIEIEVELADVKK